MAPTVSPSSSKARASSAAAIHGNKSQGARTRALADFKDNRITALVATEVAARGLDIKELPHVVNYELPNVPEDYVHRIGRTARAGLTGQAVSLVAPDEAPLLRDIERLLKRALPVSAVPQFPINPDRLPRRAGGAAPRCAPRPAARRAAKRAMAQARSHGSPSGNGQRAQPGPSARGRAPARPATGGAVRRQRMH